MNRYCSYFGRKISLQWKWLIFGILLLLTFQKTRNCCFLLFDQEAVFELDQAQIVLMGSPIWLTSLTHLTSRTQYFKCINYLKVLSHMGRCHDGMVLVNQQYNLVHSNQKRYWQSGYCGNPNWRSSNNSPKSRQPYRIPWSIWKLFSLLRIKMLHQHSSVHHLVPTNLQGSSYPSL